MEEGSKNKKTALGIGLAIVLLVVIIIIWGSIKGMGPTETFLNLGNLFTAGGNRPGDPQYYQFVLDCTTGNLVTPGELVQPGFGCDLWEANRFERPFNAITQDEYYPDLDLQYAYLGRDADWYYLRLALFDPQPGMEYLPGTYALEMDLDGDGRGDFLVLVSEPGKDNGDKWSTYGVQIWTDSNNDVGSRKPNSPDPAASADGYDTLLFDQGEGDDPNGAWARVFMTGSAYVELAFKTAFMEGDIAFKWWVWAAHGNYSPNMFELHDFFSHEQAGDANRGLGFFPIKEIFAMDSTCANMWGDAPNPHDPDFCFNDPSVFEEECPPDYQQTSAVSPRVVVDPMGMINAKLNKPINAPAFIAIEIPCEGDEPGDDPCTLTYYEWIEFVWKPAHPGDPVPADPVLWPLYAVYLQDPYCPPEGEPTPTPTFTLVPTPTFTLVPTSTPTITPTATKWIPTPTRVCKPQFDKIKCQASGGTWVTNAVDSLGYPIPPFCRCP